LTSSALRVLLTHDRFPPDFGGGGEHVVLRTAAGLRARGVDVRVLTTGDRGIREYEGVRTERLPVSRYAFNLQVRRIATAAREADIIHTFTYNACLPSYVAARWIGRPIICEVLALFGRVWRKMRGPFAGQAIQAWERFLISRPYERTLFPSERCRVAGLALGARAERSLVVPPGIDHDRFEPAERKSRYVLFAGHFDHRKGLQHVIAAARALPDIPFRAVGWSDDPLDLNTSVPPNLHITEARGGPPYWDALRGAPIFFFPSHAETFGIGLAEAMACGCAIVSSADTIKFAGEFVTPGDEPAMIRALRRLWSDKTQTGIFGRKNRELAATFTWGSHIDQLLVVYRTIHRSELGGYALLPSAD